MKKKVLVSSFILFTLLSLVGFYVIWWFVNYKKHQDIKINLVNHPEFIPSSKVIKWASAWYYNIISDFYWLSAIQYIGSNAIWSEYKKYLYLMLNLITDLNPNFTYPYQIGELLLSNYNERYESDWLTKQNTYDKQALELWLKWIKLTCDSKKIELIKKEFDLPKLWEPNSKYANPCTDSNIPYFLAYIYYWNFHDWVKASEYYKITSANTDAPTWARIMAAIMQGKWWDREKSILMFLSLAESLWTENTKECRDFSTYLGWILNKWFQNNVSLNWEFLKWIEIYRKALEDKSWWSKEETVDKWTDCVRYLNKAVREINLAYLEKIDKKYFTDKGKHAFSAKVLFEDKYIDYFPIDYQWTKDFPLNYFYDKDSWHWDNKVEDY